MTQVGEGVDPDLAVTYESRPWTTDYADDAVMSRRARLKIRGPYQAAVLPTIADREFRLPPGVAADAADALNEITRFDAELSATQLGNETEFAPLAAILLRTESASSSQIENVTAGARALAMATISEQAGPNAHLVAANVAAMQRAVAMADDLSLDSLLAAHEALMSGQDHAEPGQLRHAQVWIGGAAPSPHTADFVPPHPDRVEAAMSDLLTFCDRTDLPVLPMIAIAHAQFETIHPVADGNGRTGRALVHVLLKRAGATRRLTVPVSAGLLNDTQAYFDALTAYRDGDVEPIVERFTAAAFSAINNGRELNRDIADMYALWEHLLTARRDAAAWRLLPRLLLQPAITVKLAQVAARVSAPAAENALDQLVDAGILTPAKADRRRNRVWVADEVISALDDFAARAGRRR